VACSIQHDTDLDVAYIARSAKYPRVVVTYEPEGYRPTPAPDSSLGAEWPSANQPIRFTAHVKNRGTTAAENVRFVWRMNGAVVDSGTIDTLAPEAAVDIAHDWPWQDETHELSFELVRDATCQSLDRLALNDRRSQRTNALMLSARVWEDYAAYFEAGYGEDQGSMEDWIQRQVDRLNQMFEAAVSDVAPRGVELRIAVDEIERVPADTHDPGGTHYQACPTDLCWGFASRGTYRQWIDGLFADEIEPGIDIDLLYLWGHELGLMDPSRMSVFMDDFELTELELTDTAEDFELTDVTVGATFSSVGQRFDQLFDGQLATQVDAVAADAVWFLVHFPEPRLVSKMRLRAAAGATYDWQVWSSDDESSAVQGEYPSTQHGTGQIAAQVDDFAEITFFPANARVWLIKVDRTDGDQISLLEWELHDPNGRISVFNPVAGSPVMPDLGGRLMREVSVHPDLMSTVSFEISPHTAWALNTTAVVNDRPVPRRRGWYGDYLLKIPTKNALLVTSGGVPVKSASIEIYQREEGAIRKIPKFTGQTDADGRFEIPEYTTLPWQVASRMADNHVLTPFESRYGELPSVLGDNGVLVVRISAGGPPIYRFLDVPQFNLEYARGHHDDAVYPLEIGPL
jgi:hypothetical protein